jgi:hypothetical protein
MKKAPPRPLPTAPKTKSRRDIPAQRASLPERVEPTEQVTPPEVDVDEPVQVPWWATIYSPEPSDDGPSEPPAPPVGAGRRTLDPLELDKALAVVLTLAVVAVLAALFFEMKNQDEKPEVAPGAPPSSLAAPPAALPPVGSYVESRILPSGDIQVTEWIRTRTDVSEIELVAPNGDGPAGSPTARDVVVTGDDLRADGQTQVSDSARYVFADPARLIQVRYMLTGAVEQSPSAPGRALARYTSLDVRYTPKAGPTKVHLLGAEVLATACTSAEAPLVPRPCGWPQGGAWQVRLRGDDRDDHVMAQVNLG